ncbi:FAD-dependent oxidoreductase [Candidatus Uhrbacteria bacterium]|nr:FAD-dependent oxidoreductase [Candidatus Uhrbacteria bacterium]
MEYDIVIVGGGILGTALAYQLSKHIPGERIVVVEKEEGVARHTSSRNTGVIHRPFYLDPISKGKFARCAQESYEFWKEYAARKGLPWREVGTLEVALDEAQLARLKKYKAWSLQNGMGDSEVRLLSAEEVREIEPSAWCAGALLCTTDTAVDFGAFTRALRDDAEERGVKFLFGCEVKKIVEKKDGVDILYQRLITPPTPSYLKRGNFAEVPPLRVRGGEEGLRAHYMVNCAGGAALKIAHLMGVAREFADLNFRGEYLIVEGESARLALRNVYSVPRHTDFPFLDPHYVVRVDGRVEIGPSAVPVFGSYAYRGVGNVLGKLTEKPLANKLRLLRNPEFLRLCGKEWRSALSKDAMVARVQKFLPDLRVADCVARGTAGVRASLIDRNGRFVPEVVEAQTPRSLHILNYNSPGATGAPAYAADLTRLISKL